ncbi:MAG: DUF3685 domain-containing protein [Kastovskya adunca ATA6-11-RM4]|jgi:DNA-binding NarL/FixJ family response regulator|nr:DUF3685 domain-containing protein [Kastovskya adunca ATA6-11-RM4]
MSDRVFKLLLIDDDPIFRLGLRTALDTFPDLQVVAEADTGTAALELLGRRSAQEAIDLIVLELNQKRYNPNELSGLQLCQQLKYRYPRLPILLLTPQLTQEQRLNARAAGVDGYCPKGTDISELVTAMRQLCDGQPHWVDLPIASVPQISSVRPPSWHGRLRQSGLQQIEDEIMGVNTQLQKPQLSTFDWLFWSGRRRELVAARWIVNQLLPTDVLVVEPPRDTPANRPRIEPPSRRTRASLQSTPNEQLPPAEAPAIEPVRAQLSVNAQELALFDVVASQTSGVRNLTDIPLEIDILQEERQRDLLYIVLEKFQEILDDLRFSQISPEQVPLMRSRILIDLWQSSLTDFFGKYYTLPLNRGDFEVVDALLQDAPVINDQILDKIPLVTELLLHRLFQASLVVDNVSYKAETPEAKARAEVLLQNLIVQVANAVVQPLLNNLADVETIKQSFFNRRMLSSREIARFRNDLSWKYRTAQWLWEPKSIFESRYYLFVLSSIGIKQISIYAPRRQELQELRGWQLAVTIALEGRDAIAPRLRGTVGLLGKGTVYTLTQVLGRAIGLIIRGVIQGVGSALQDTRFGKNGERGK